jgi:hypothetical protein
MITKLNSKVLTTLTADDPNATEPTATAKQLLTSKLNINPF